MMSDEFIEYEHSVQNERIRLFCFHYAGGNASFYSDWYKYLSSDIGVYPVQLPGRGKRWGAEMYTSVEEASEIIASQIQSYSDVPLIFTGHSMGGLIAYQTALMLQDNYGISLKQLFITGSYPEMGVDNISDAYKLTDSEFCERLKSYGGIDERVFKIKQFYTFFLPVIKNDFLMAGKYKPDKNRKLNCGISVYGGDQDALISDLQLNSWKSRSLAGVNIRLMAGGNFFLKENKEIICRDISNFAKTVSKGE